MSSQPSNNHVDQAIDALIADFQGKGEPDATPVTPPVPSPPPVNPPPKPPKPSSKMEMAKLGDADAITAVLNQLLQPQGISAKATLKTDILSVVLQGNKAPDQENCVAYLRKFVDQLDLVFLNKLLITGRRQGATFAAWTQQVDLTISEKDSQSLTQSVTSGISNLSTTATNTIDQTIAQTVQDSQLGCLLQTLQDQISRYLFDLFDQVTSERKAYYASNPDKIPTQQDLNSIISNYAMKNSGIAGACNLVPGVSIALVFQEIQQTLKYQLAMIYDISLAYDRNRSLPPELLMGVFSYGIGQGAIGVLTVQGNKILVKSVSKIATKSIVKKISRKIARKLFKSQLGKFSQFIPGIGAAAMAAWANYSTRQLGKKAQVILKQNIEYSTDLIDDTAVEVEAYTVSDSDNSGISDTVKVQALINLMKIDGKIESAERQYLNTFIQNIEVSEKDKVDLLIAVDNPSKFSIDYSQFTQSPDDAIALLIDMIALSQHDGEFHVAEKVYIKQVGKQMGLSESDIEEMLVS